MAEKTSIIADPEETTIIMRRMFEAPRRLVFEAWTRPEHVARWLGRRGDTMTVCEIDLRVGGAWRYVWQLREGGEMGMRGVYREIVPPERLVYTEVFEGPYFEEMGGETLNTLTLEEQDGRTTMTTTTLYKSRAARDSAMQTGMEDGIDESFDRLAELLKSMA